MVDNENSESYKLSRPQLASPTFLKCFGVKDGLSIEMLYSFVFVLYLKLTESMLILVNLVQCTMIQIIRNGYRTPS